MEKSMLKQNDCKVYYVVVHLFQSWKRPQEKVKLQSNSTVKPKWDGWCNYFREEGLRALLFDFEFAG